VAIGAKQEGDFEEGEDGGEGGEEPEGDDEVPQHAALAVEAAKIDAEEFEAFEWVIPVFADLAAEGEAAGMGDDPIAGVGFSDVDTVGDFEGWAGDVVTAVPQDGRGEAEKKAENCDDVEEDASHDGGWTRGGRKSCKGACSVNSR
jgi:hypothetical protein